jgi:hypothetical protein
VSQPPAPPPNAGPIADTRDCWLLRLVIAGCQAAAIGLTWNLWQARAAGPPNLPIIDAAWIDGRQEGFGWLLLASLALAILWPRGGVICHVIALVLAIAFDQMRIQPEFISVAILLVGTLGRGGPLLVARCHLISLWGFAGLHKLLCPDYWTDTGPYLAHLLLPQLSERLAIAAGLAIACCELLTGLFAIFPRTRPIVPWLAAALHGGIVLSLAVNQWNSAVWPWNIALAAAAFGLFFGWKGQLFERGDSLPPQPVPSGERALPLTQANPLLRWGWQAAAVIALLHPALYYVNCSDAYVSWCVYSNNTPEATYHQAANFGDDGRVPPDWQVLAGGGEELLFREYDQVNVPFPPAPRLYRQYLRRTGQPGDSIAINDPRLLSRWLGRKQVVLILQPDGTILERIPTDH